MELDQGHHRPPRPRRLHNSSFARLPLPPPHTPSPAGTPRSARRSLPSLPPSPAQPRLPTHAFTCEGFELETRQGTRGAHRVNACVDIGGGVWRMRARAASALLAACARPGRRRRRLHTTGITIGYGWLVFKIYKTVNFTLFTILLKLASPIPHPVLTVRRIPTCASMSAAPHSPARSRLRIHTPHPDTAYNRQSYSPYTLLSYALRMLTPARVWASAWTLSPALRSCHTDMGVVLSIVVRRLCITPQHSPTPALVLREAHPDLGQAAPAHTASLDPLTPHRGASLNLARVPSSRPDHELGSPPMLSYALPQAHPEVHVHLGEAAHADARRRRRHPQRYRRGPREDARGPVLVGCSTTTATTTWRPHRALVANNSHTPMATPVKTPGSGSSKRG